MNSTASWTLSSSSSQRDVTTMKQSANTTRSSIQGGSNRFHDGMKKIMTEMDRSYFSYATKKTTKSHNIHSSTNQTEPQQQRQQPKATLLSKTTQAQDQQQIQTRKHRPKQPKQLQKQEQLEPLVEQDYEDEEESWRKYGAMYRKRLIDADVANGNTSFRLNKNGTPESYFQLVERVIVQFVILCQDLKHNADDAYVIGNRLIVFLTKALPKHPQLWNSTTASTGSTTSGTGAATNSSHRKISLSATTSSLSSSSSSSAKAFQNKVQHDLQWIRAKMKDIAIRIDEEQLNQYILNEFVIDEIDINDDDRNSSVSDASTSSILDRNIEDDDEDEEEDEIVFYYEEENEASGKNRGALVERLQKTKTNNVSKTNESQATIISRNIVKNSNNCNPLPTSNQSCIGLNTKDRNTTKTKTSATNAGNTSSSTTFSGWEQFFDTTWLSCSSDTSILNKRCGTSNATKTNRITKNSSTYRSLLKNPTKNRHNKNSNLATKHPSKQKTVSWLDLVTSSNINSTKNVFLSTTKNNDEEDDDDTYNTSSTSMASSTFGNDTSATTASTTMLSFEDDDADEQDASFFCSQHRIHVIEKDDEKTIVQSNHKTEAITTCTEQKEEEESSEVSIVFTNSSSTTSSSTSLYNMIMSHSNEQPIDDNNADQLYDNNNDSPFVSINELNTLPVSRSNGTSTTRADLRVDNDKNGKCLNSTTTNMYNLYNLHDPKQQHPRSALGRLDVQLLPSYQSNSSPSRMRKAQQVFNDPEPALQVSFDGDMEENENNSVQIVVKESVVAKDPKPTSCNTTIVSSLLNHPARQYYSQKIKQLRSPPRPSPKPSQQHQQTFKNPATPVNSPLRRIMKY